MMGALSLILPPPPNRNYQRNYKKKLIYENKRYLSHVKCLHATLNALGFWKSFSVNFIRTKTIHYITRTLTICYIILKLYGVGLTWADMLTTRTLWECGSSDPVTSCATEVLPVPTGPTNMTGF